MPPVVPIHHQNAKTAKQTRPENHRGTEDAQRVSFAPVATTKTRRNHEAAHSPTDKPQITQIDTDRLNVLAAHRSHRLTQIRAKEKTRRRREAHAPHYS